MKVLINRCYGGFGLSNAVAVELGVTVEDGAHKADYDIAESLGIDLYDKVFRCDPRIVAAVERVVARGEQASSAYGDVHIVEIPDDVDWLIEEYDGMEQVAERHRSWF